MNDSTHPVFRGAQQATSPPGIATGWVRESNLAWTAAFLLGLQILLTGLANDLFAATEVKAGPSFDPSIGSRLIKLALLAFGTVVLIWRARLAMVMLRWINPFFLAFLVLVPLSTLWSISRGDTLARFVSILTMVQISMAFVLFGWHAQRMQGVLRTALTILIFGSLAYGLAYPKLGIEQGEGTLANAWRGLTSQKNQFGQLSSFATILWLHALLFRQSKLWRIVLAGAASVLCVLLSRSSTSLLATLFSIGFMLMLYRTPENLRRYMPFIVSAFATILVVYAMAVLKIVPGLDILLEPIVAFTGKDLTFSNRSEIWVIIKEHMQLSPWIGSGYGAYWIGAKPPSPSIVFLTRMYFYPAESHNGYIEVTNDLGFLGLCVLLGYLVYYVKQSLQLMKIDRGQGVLFLSLFFQQAILNLSGSSWLTVNSGSAFLIMTLATVAMARCQLDDKLYDYFGRPEVIERHR
ncbi:MAG: O-antigen ligase family protein [Nevskia sp.]